MAGLKTEGFPFPLASAPVRVLTPLMTRLRFLLVSLFSAVGAALGRVRQQPKFSVVELASSIGVRFASKSSYDGDYLRTQAWRDGRLVWDTTTYLAGFPPDDRVAVERDLARQALDWAKSEHPGSDVEPAIRAAVPSMVFERA